MSANDSGKRPSQIIPTPVPDDDWEHTPIEVTPIAPSGKVRTQTSPGFPAAVPVAGAASMAGAPSSSRGGHDGGATARKALAKIDELGRRFDTFEKRADERDKALTKRFEEHAVEDRELFSKIGDKLDEQGGTLGDVRVSCAETATEIKGIASEMRYQRELERAERVAGIEDKKDAKGVKRQLKLEWWKVLAGLVLAGGSAVIGALVSSL